jgi:hypothetical protein
MRPMLSGWTPATRSDHSSHSEFSPVEDDVFSFRSFMGAGTAAAEAEAAEAETAAVDDNVSNALAEFSISVVAIRDLASGFASSLLPTDVFFAFLVSTFESPIAILGLHLRGSSINSVVALAC